MYYSSGPPAWYTPPRRTPMSALAVAHPPVPRSRITRLRPVPDLTEPPVTVTISIAGGAGAGRDRVLAALRDLVSAAGSTVEVAVSPIPESAAGQLQLDPQARTATRDGQPLDLSRLEYDLLLFLARHPRQVFSRSQLLAQVW